MSATTSAPASPRGSFAVVADLPLEKTIIGVNVATAGTVDFLNPDGSVGSVFVAAGIAFPLAISTQINSTSTASDIVGLWQ